MKTVLLALSFLILTSCSSVTVRTDNAKKSREMPHYEHRFHYFWWGLKGNHKVNVRVICQGREAKQLQSISTFSDSFFTLITLGIYAPRTARIWCQEES